MKAVMSFAMILMLGVGSACAGDPPQTPEKKTVPGTGGYVWGSGAPQSPNNVAPATGGSLGVQYPPDRPTTVRCSRDGKPVPC
jgi:hypothetical protein